MAKKLFIGYDLGDGETITDLAILDDQQVRAGSRVDIISMTMPDNNTAGQAIPTVYGVSRETGRIVFASSILNDPEDVRNIHSNFKRCPSDLMAPMDEPRRLSLMNALQQGWPAREDYPELYTEQLMAFAEAVQSFTDALFTDEKFCQVIASSAVGCREIVFCVGHPTRWDEFDAAVYAGILRRTVIGQSRFRNVPATLVMAAESRAAFLYVKNNTGMVDIIPKNQSALLIDIGSSTIDLTALSADSRNNQYNSGNNYLGARGIDYLILEWYLERLRKSPEDWEEYEQLIAANPTMLQAAVLSCRKAKEDVYSQSSGKSKILFANFAPMRVNRDDITALAQSMPLQDVLSRYAQLPDEVRNDMGRRSWTEQFEEFLNRSKREMTRQKLNITRIILTGSASKMPFVHDIVSRVFDKAQVLNDADPSRSISKGLALVGPSNEKSLDFQTELNELVRTDVPQIISDDLSALAGPLARHIETVVVGIVQDCFREWQSGAITTLEQMSWKIERACSEDCLDELLSQDREYNEIIQAWLVDTVGRDIAIRLKKVCDKYGMAGINLDQLNLLKVSGIDLGNKVVVTPGAEIVDAIANAVAVVAGIITTVILPVVLVIVLEILALVASNIAWLLCSALMLIPGWGIAILIGLAGVAVFNAMRKGMDGAKQMLLDKLQAANLPQKARKLISENKVMQKLNEARLHEKIEESIMEPRCVDQIVSSISDKLSLLILKRAEDIKYVLESK